MKLQTKHSLPWMLLPGILVVVLCGMKPASLLADSDDPSSRVARLGSLQGTVSIQPAGVNDWSAASMNYPVATGDRLYTDNDGRTEVQIGETVARMSHNTDLTMTNLADNMVQLGLAQGTLRLRTFSLSRQSQVEVDTPNGALTMHRAGDVRVDSYGDDGGTVVTVNTGEVELTGPGLSQRVGQGQSIRLLGSNPIEIENAEMSAPDQFDTWSMQRDRRMMQSTSARYVSRESPGYDDLDEYGDWSPQSDYGPVWYPRSVPAGWVPYRYGHWVWTGPWGWTWVEDEPWGYTPFHYGRWAHIDDRWGWIPGPVEVRPIWSPALVAFVGGSRIGIGVAIGGGGGLSAWFPLGPGEAYAPWYHCSPRYVNQVNITNIRVTRIVNVQNNYNITNINNTNYVHRTVATTAVSAQDFRSARPVATNMVRIDPRQLAQAQVIPHPDIKPTMQSVAPRPVSVRVASTRPTLLTQGGREAPAVLGARSQPVPYKPLPPNAIQRADTVHPVGNPATTARPGLMPSAPRGSYNGAPNPPAAHPENNPGGSNQGGMNQGGMNQGGRQTLPTATNQPAVNTGGRLPINHQGDPARPVFARPPAEAGGSVPAPAYGNGRQLPPQARPAPVQNQLPPQHAPVQNAPVQGNPSPVQRNAQQGQQPLVYRNETPAPRPTFQQQQPAMDQHPGRPLEPRQMDNIHQGRPAGPQRDQELIPHAQPQPQQRPAPPPQAQQRPVPSPPQQQQHAAPPPQRGAPPASQEHPKAGESRERNQ